MRKAVFCFQAWTLFEFLGNGTGDDWQAVDLRERLCEEEESQHLREAWEDDQERRQKLAWKLFETEAMENLEA